MYIFITILFILAVIAFIGHGIWVLVAMIFRAMFGGENGRTVEPQVRCEGCGAAVRADDDFCATCGRYQRRPSEAGPLADLSITARQADRFLSQGKIDAATHRGLMAAIEEERERLTRPLRPAPAPQTLPQPVISAPPANTPSEPEPLAQPNARRPVTEAADVIRPAAPPPVFSRSEAPIAHEPEPMATAVPQAAQSKPEPRRSLTEMLEAFMEESSIRWGELIGGLLIIGCSLALVISLWSQITAVPLLKFSVFVGLTAGLFGMGFYSAHRWRLPTTSRGALIIATLLVPLNFLAMTAFSKSAGQNSLLIVGGEVLALALFLFLVYQAGRVITAGNAWLLASATLAPSAAMLVAKHWQAGFTPLVFLGIAPIFFYWLSTGLMLRATPTNNWPKVDWDEAEVDRAFTFFGIASFASVLPVGLLLINSGSLTALRAEFAPLLVVLGVPAILAGLTLHQAKIELPGKVRTVAATIGILGAMLATGGLVLAWPNAVAIITVALLNFLICAAIAWRFKLRSSHAAAIAFFALAYLTSCGVISGHYPSWSEDGRRLLASYLSQFGGLALLSLFVLLAVAAEAWRRFGYRAESRFYDVAAAASALFSLLLLSLHGFGRAGDPNDLALVYAFYACGGIAIAWCRDRVIPGWVGLALFFFALVQAFVYRFGYALAPHHPVRLTLLSYASLMTVGAVAMRNAGEKARRIFARPMTTAALVSSVAAVPLLLFGGWMTVGQMAARLFWLSGVWLALSLLRNWRILFSAFQTVMTIAVVCLVAAIFDGRALPSHSNWFDPHQLQAQGIALALLSLGWLALRIVVRRRENESGSIAQLLSPPWPTVDRFVTVLVWALLIALSIAGFSEGALRTFASSGLLSEVSGDYSARAREYGSWVLLAALLLVFVGSFWERFSKRAVLAAMTLLGCASLLLAGEWQGAASPVSLLRWFLAVSFASVGLLILHRDKVRKICERFHWPQLEEEATGLAALSRAASIALFAVPVVALTMGQFLSRVAAGGPLIPEVLVFLAPLLILSATLTAHAVRERSSAYALSSGLILNLATTLGCLLDVNARLITILQANVIVAAAFSLVWLAVWKRMVRNGTGPDQRPPLMLQAQIIFTLGLSLALLGIADLLVFLQPETPSTLVTSMGSVGGWLTMLLPALGWLSLHNRRIEQVRVNELATALLVVVSLVVCSLSRVTSGWTAYHALMSGVGLVGWLLLLMRWRREAIFTRFPRFQLEGRDASVGWVTILALLQLALTLPGMSAENDLWWTVGSFATLCLLFVGLAAVTKQRAYVYLSGVLCNSIASRLFVEHHNLLDDFQNFAFINIIILALSSVLWLILDLRIRRHADGQLNRRIAPFHRFAAVFSLILVALIAGLQWLTGLDGGQVDFLRLDWLAVLSVAALLLACVWDVETALSVRGLYVWGVVLIVKASAEVLGSRYQLLALTAGLLSLYVLAVTFFVHQRHLLRAFTARFHNFEEPPLAEKILSWISRGDLVLAVFVTFSSLATIFNSPSLKLRLAVTTAAFALPAALGMLARDWNRPRLITGSRRLFWLTLLLWSWAWLPSRDVGQIINRLVVTTLVASAILIVYRLVMAKRLHAESEWRIGLRTDLEVIAGAGLLSLSAVLVNEVENYLRLGRVQMEPLAVVAVLVTLLGLCLCGLAFAVFPGEDPFGLDGRRRAGYVYAAEGMIVLTLMHMRLTAPWLFGGIFTTYWPLIIMALAFVGVGLSELLRRQDREGLLVLATPLERTGILLPLLPVIGFWALSSEVPYSVLLLLVGLFYGWLSVRRKSFAYGILAAVAGNSGLWNFLRGKSGYSFSQHPQLWLIPAALSVLLAARINRDSLSKEQISSIRYGALITIYVSSTADIFLNGVQESPWLPIVLAVLSVCGVLAGLAMRVRSFLFLGTAFLLLSILTMIWSASVNLNWTWLWYVTGIGLGVFIIYTFAMFERRREELLRFVSRLKQWQ